MRIGIDLDGTIANGDIEMSRRMTFAGYKNDPSLWHDYYLENNHPELPVEWISKQFSDPVFWLNAIPFEDAWYMVKKWFMEGNDIFIISCRPDNVFDASTRWLDEWDIYYNRLFCGVEKYKKFELVNKLKLDCFIEDDPVEAEILADHTKSFLLSKRWNLSHERKAVQEVLSFYEIDGRFVKHGTVKTDLV